MDNDLRKVTRKTKEELRIKAVQAVIEQGKKQIDVAAFFCVKREVVCRWIKTYKEGGYNALKAKPKGRPQNSSRLKPWQAARIVKTITEKTPDQVKFPFMLWTRDCVAELIEKKYGIHMSRWTVGRLLRKWGLTITIFFCNSYNLLFCVGFCFLSSQPNLLFSKIRFACNDKKYLDMQQVEFAH